MKSLRRRYLALDLESDEGFTADDFMSALWRQVFTLYGDYGASQTYLKLIDYKMPEKFAVVRTTHRAVTMVRAALASITHIRDKPVAIHVLRVSGTIKTLYER